MAKEEEVVWGTDQLQPEGQQESQAQETQETQEKQGGEQGLTREELEQERERLRKEIMAEIRQETQQTPSDYGQGKTEDELADIETKLFTDPKDALTKWAKRIKEETINEVRNEYQQTRAQEQFWSDFYSEHPHLKGAKDVVQGVFSQSYQRLANMEIGEAKQELAKLANERVTEIAKSVGVTKRDSRAVAESGSGPQEQPSKQSEEEEGPSSLTDVIRKRKQKMRSTA